MKKLIYASYMTIQNEVESIMAEKQDMLQIEDMNSVSPSIIKRGEKRTYNFRHRKTPADSEKLLRENMKKLITSVLEQKAKLIPDTKESVESIAEAIEQELLSAFGSVGNKKFQAKFKAILCYIK